MCHIIYFVTGRAAECSAERGISYAGKESEDIFRLFQQFMAEGDLDSVMSLYDPEAVFLNQSCEITKDGQGSNRGFMAARGTNSCFISALSRSSRLAISR
jgi:hypothetical protein